MQPMQPEPVVSPRMRDVLEYGRAPYAKLRHRVRQGELEEDRAFRRAMDASVGCDVPKPVVFEGKHLGWVKGEGSFSPRVHFKRRRDWEKWECAITSYDQIVNAFQAGNEWKGLFNKVHTTAFSVANNYYDLWPVVGDPVSGAFGGAAFTAVRKDDTTVGSLWMGGNVSTLIKNMGFAFMMSSGGTPTLTIYDRCLCYEANTFNANANQVMTNTNTLLRYQNAGEGGCKVVISVQTVTGATAANLNQLRYTDQDGNTLQSMPTTTTVTFIPSAAAPTANLGARHLIPSTSGATVLWGPYVPLAVGDGGVRLINDWTTSAANTGTVTITLLRPLVIVPCQTAGLTSVYDLVEQLAGFVRIRDGACITAHCYAPATTATTINGGMQAVWG